MTVWYWRSSVDRRNLLQHGMGLQKISLQMSGPLSNSKKIQWSGIQIKDTWGLETYTSSDQQNSS